MLRGTGIVAALAIYPTIRYPNVAGMVAFLCITIFLHGPLAPLLPAAHEAVLMVTGRVYPPLLVAVVGIAGTLYMEYINYHLYRAALLHPKLERTRQSALVRRTVALFERAPFFCTWLCSWSPLPYWAVRFLAPLSGYPVRSYLVATFLGRGPRYYVIALFGELLPISTLALALITVVMIGLAVAIAAIRGRIATRSAPAVPEDLAGDFEHAHD